MRILVVGAGALGSWLGAHLTRGGADVTLVARGAHGAAMAGGGLSVIAPSGPFALRPTVAASVAQAFADPSATFDVTLVTVKSWASAEVGQALASAGQCGRVISMQNGVGNEAMLAAALEHRVPDPLYARAARPCPAVGAGAVTVGVTVDQPGVIAVSSGGGVGLEDDRGGYGRALGARLTAGGVAVHLVDDPVALKWSKLLLNMLGAATAAIVDRAPIDVLARRDVFAVEVGAWREALAAMRHIGAPPIDLPGYRMKRFAAAARWLPIGFLHRAFARRLAEGRGHRLPGMGADLRAGRATSEVEVLHGAVVAVADAAGLRAPICRTLASLVLGLADGSIARARYAGHPDALCAAVDAARRSSSGVTTLKRSIHP